MTTVTDNATTIEIKNATYAVAAIPAGEMGVSAVRVTKPVNGESYDVVRTTANVVECSCPDFVCRHEGKGTVCKHGAAMVARGFLPAAPTPAPVAKPSVAPITRKDLARAAMFGLKLPAGVPIEPAPAFVPPSPATPDPVVITGVVVVAQAVEVDDPTGNPRDSWPDWTDEVWTIAPEPVAEAAPVVAPEPAKVVEATCDPGFKVELPLAWVEVSPGLKRIVNTTPDRYEGPTKPETNSSPRPYRPTILDDAYHSGWSLGNSGENPIAPREWSALRLAHFYQGVADGQAELHWVTQEWQAWVESNQADHPRHFDLEPGELAEGGVASGHPSYETCHEEAA